MSQSAEAQARRALRGRSRGTPPPLLLPHLLRSSTACALATLTCPSLRGTHSAAQARSQRSPSCQVRASAPTTFIRRGGGLSTTRARAASRPPSLQRPESCQVQDSERVVVVAVGKEEMRDPAIKPRHQRTRVEFCPPPVPALQRPEPMRLLLRHLSERRAAKFKTSAVKPRHQRNQGGGPSPTRRP